MNTFENGYFIELDQENRGIHPGIIFGIKDYFFFDYTANEYSYRDTIIPVDFILNKSEIPDESALRDIINKKELVMKRVIDLTTQKENWVFVPTEETK